MKISDLAEKNINDLLAKYIAHESMSEDEKKTVQLWIVQNPEEFDKLLKLTSILGNDIHNEKMSAVKNAFHVNEAWEKVSEKISDRDFIKNKENDDEKIKSIKPSMKGKSVAMDKNINHRNIFLVAASVAVLMIMSLTYFLNSSRVGSDTGQDDYILFAINDGNTLKTTTLPDSSTVILYPDASIRYRFTENSARYVALNGKAFFDVRKRNGTPFKVESKNLSVEVLGTSFLVDDSADISAENNADSNVDNNDYDKAYNDAYDNVSHSGSNITNNSGKVSSTVSPEGKSSEKGKGESNEVHAGVYVKTGVVSVSSSGQKVVIKASQKAELKGSRLTTDSITNPSEVFGASHDEKLIVFENTPIKDVVKKIQEATGVVIEYDKELGNNSITSKISFPNEANVSDIETVMKELSFLCKCRYQTVEEGKRYKLVR